MRELLPFLQQLWRHRWQLTLGTTLLLATLIAGIGLLGLSGWFITATAIAGAAGVAIDLFTPSGGIRFFALGRAASRYFERLINHDAVLRLLADLRGWLFRRLSVLPLERLGRLRSSDLLNRITADIDALDNLYLRVIGPSIAAVLAILLTTLFLAAFAPGLAVAVGAVLAAAGILVPAVALRLGQPFGERETVHLPSLRAAATETVTGLAELRAYAAVARHGAKLAVEERALTAARRAAGRLAAAGEAAAGLAGHLALGVALVLGIGLYHQDLISGPVLVLLPLAALAAAEAVTPLPQAWQHLGRTRAAARRLLELGSPEQSAVTAQLPRDHGLSLSGVSFRYHPYAEPVLAEANLEVRPGEAVVITGASGAGKSTIAELLAGLRSAEHGQVRLGGVEVGALPESERYARIGYLTQYTELFADTVADNLRLGNPQAAESDLWRALEVVDLADFIAELPRGLNEWCGEGGVRFSGGQARRLALARLLIANPPVVLLDEPFSGLDADTANVVRERMQGWLQGRTVITLSHTPEAAPRYDRALRVQNGLITEVN